MTLWRETAPEPEPSLGTAGTKGARTFPTGPLEHSVYTRYSENDREITYTRGWHPSAVPDSVPDIADPPSSKSGLA